MLRKKISLALVVLTLGAAITGLKSANAQCDYAKKRNVIAILCYNGEGQVVGFGNTCSDGTNECETNFCPQ